MTRKEFSDGFDTLLNSYNTAALHGDAAFRAEIVLDEWEKSFFLTKAQEKLVLSLYSGNNSRGESFETTEEVRRYLAPLVRECNCTKAGDDIFSLPKDLWFIVYESMNGSGVEGDGCDSYFSNVEVYPVTHDEYNRIKKNPFRGPTERRALRLDVGDGKVKLVCERPVNGYFIRYIKKPRPIILEDFPDDLTINGENKTYKIVKETTDDGEVEYKEELPACELHEALHQTILDEAMKLAYTSKALGRSTEKEKDSK